MRFVDPAHQAAATLLRTCGAAQVAMGTTRVLTTGDGAQMRRAAKAAFGVTLPAAENLAL